MPSFLILRKHRTSEEVELAVENVEALSVKELRQNAALKLDIPLEELSKVVLKFHIRGSFCFVNSELVYGGRILKTGKAVADYKVMAGCTIFAMAIKPKKCVRTRLKCHGDVSCAVVL